MSLQTIISHWCRTVKPSILERLLKPSRRSWPENFRKSVSLSPLRIQCFCGLPQFEKPVFSVLFCCPTINFFIILCLTYTERYRSGHNGADSKIFEKVSVLSAKNPVFLRAPAVRKTEYFAVLSVSSFQKFWEGFSDWHMESCPSGRRCSTRNIVGFITTVSP